MMDATRLRLAAPDTANVLARGARRGLLAAGVLAIAILGARALGHDYDAGPAVVPAPVAPATVVAEAATDDEDDQKEVGLSPAMSSVAGYLSRKYHVSSAALHPVITAAETAGRELGLDPLLIISVVAIESSFNPFAESVRGAQGLMQIIPRFHVDKLEDGDETALLDPETNIEIGAKILKECIRRSGSLIAGLQSYAGAPSDTETNYANKVLAEKERLKQAMKRLQVAGNL